jgi:hypothetical protein
MARSLSLTIGLCVAGALMLSAATLATAATPSTTRIGDLRFARSDHSATRLPDGRILVVGGTRIDTGRDVRVPVLTAELVDPITGTATPAGRLPRTMSGHTAILLPHRRVLLVGGAAGRSKCTKQRPLLWDGATKRFSAVGAIDWSFGASATELADGRVLIAGGGRSCGGRMEDTTAPPRAVIWDPATGETTPTGSPQHRRERHAAVRLADGRVLIAGGWDVRFLHEGGPVAVRQAEVWDPDSGAWMPIDEPGWTQVAGLLALRDGRVAVTPGVPSGAARLSLWTPEGGGGAWSEPTDGPRMYRGQRLVPLVDGAVGFICGRGKDRGDRQGLLVRRAQRWDPQFDVTTSMDWLDGTRLRSCVRGVSASPLGDGRVIVIGGSGGIPSGERSRSAILRWDARPARWH